MNFSKILELNELAKVEAKKYNKKIFIYRNILSDKRKHFIGVVGPIKILLKEKI